METIIQSQSRPAATDKFLYMIALAFGAAFICKWLGTQAQSAFEAHVQSPLWRSVLGYYGVMIVLVTFVGLGLSLTPVAQLESYGASQIGYALLFIVLARFGAKGNLNAIRESPAYLLMGVVWILTHGALLLFAAKRLRVPIFLSPRRARPTSAGPCPHRWSPRRINPAWPSLGCSWPSSETFSAHLAACLLWHRWFTF